MFTPGDIVQPRMGGPKLKVIEVNEDHIVAVQVGNETGEKIDPQSGRCHPLLRRGRFWRVLIYQNEHGATFPESRLIETGNEAPSVKSYP
ncbi:hypothetical protein SEEH1576_18804 [Salmonella enterica subsp. enterica serovar Heidelberg str. 41576]|nr:hypothetical protein SEEH1576_18804 [Salmonella enterica subsp. enterica serovar Heidelberg str. 41576]